MKLYYKMKTDKKWMLGCSGQTAGLNEVINFAVEAVADKLKDDKKAGWLKIGIEVESGTIVELGYFNLNGKFIYNYLFRTEV